MLFCCQRVSTILLYELQWWTMSLQESELLCHLTIIASSLTIYMDVLESIGFLSPVHGPRLTALLSWSLSSSSSSSSELLLCWYRRLFVQPSHLPLPLKLASFVSKVFQYSSWLCDFFLQVICVFLLRHASLVAKVFQNSSWVCEFFLQVISLFH